MERKFTKKIIFMVLVAVMSIFTFVGVVSAAQQTPLTLDSSDSFSDIGSSSSGASSSTSNTANNTTNNTANNTASNKNTSKTNNAAQSNTKIPQTGSNSIVYFVSGLLVLAIVSVISISLYSKIKLS